MNKNLKTKADLIQINEYPDNDNIANINIENEKNQKLEILPFNGYEIGNSSQLCYNLLNNLKNEIKFFNISVKLFKSHVKMLEKREIINENIATQIQNTLNQIKKSFNNNKIDINTYISKNISGNYTLIGELLKEALGEAGLNAYIGLSKQEHNAAITRIWLRDSIDVIDLSIQSLQNSLLDKAESNVKNVIPSYINNNFSQPVSFSHHLMSYLNALQRDRERLSSLRKRINISPIGSYMMAGSSFNINRKVLARYMEFDEISQNSIDSLSNKDYIIEFQSTLTICAEQVSKIAQDLLHWSNPNLNYINISEEILSQDHTLNKMRLPEILEYVRSKVGNISGALMNSIITIKGINTGFSRDLEELSEPAYSSYQSMINILHALTIIVNNIAVNRKRTKERSQSYYGLAPDLVNWLIQNLNLNYIEAKNIAEKIIHKAQENNTKLSLLELSDLQSIHSAITPKIFSIFMSSRDIIQNRSEGGTNPVKIRKAIRKYRRMLLSSKNGIA